MAEEVESWGDIYTSLQRGLLALDKATVYEDLYLDDEDDCS